MYLDWKSRMFFLTKEDVTPIITVIEEEFDVCYHQAGMFSRQHRRVFPAAKKLPHFGAPIAEDWSRDNRYLMLPQKQKLIVRDVPQQKGGIRYAVDMEKNKKNVVYFQFGGIVRDGLLLAGKISISDQGGIECKILKRFASMLRKNTRYMAPFYVGRNAEEKLKAGWRLVCSELQPEACDMVWYKPKKIRVA